MQLHVDYRDIVHCIAFCITVTPVLDFTENCKNSGLIAVYSCSFHAVQVSTADMCTLLCISTADEPSVTVHAVQDEHPVQLTTQSTTSNTFERTIPDGTIQAKKDYRVVVKCENRSVNIYFTAANCTCKCACTKLVVTL